MKKGQEKQFIRNLKNPLDNQNRPCYKLSVFNF